MNHFTPQVTRQPAEMPKPDFLVRVMDPGNRRFGTPFQPQPILRWVELPDTQILSRTDPRRLRINIHIAPELTNEEVDILSDAYGTEWGVWWGLANFVELANNHITLEFTLPNVVLLRLDKEEATVSEVKNVLKQHVPDMWTHFLETRTPDETQVSVQVEGLEPDPVTVLAGAGALIATGAGTAFLLLRGGV